ncbi:MAG: glutamate dehydrogenase, partial [Bacteroidota bacterium]
VLTGKGIQWGGSLIRPEATGYGSVYFAQEMLKNIGEGLKGKICTVSGSGNVAQFTTQKINELGGKVVTLSDSGGYIYDPAGVDDEKLAFVMELKNIKRGRIYEYAEKFGVEYIEGERPWKVKCEAAFPSATENEINAEEAKALISNGCKVVSEGANMPSTPEAIEEYLRAKILYGPGKAANAGGVAVSGLEMTQNSMRLPWSREEVDNRLHTIMQNIHKTCLRYGKEDDGYVNYVKGANIGGFVKVADAMIAQGVV